MQDSKSTILNKEFKETYRRFLLSLLFNPSVEGTEKNQLVMAYYLVLQDRVLDAGKVFRRIEKVRSKTI